MLVLEYKIKANKKQLSCIDEAIRTTQFVRNKCLRFWMDSSRESKINGFALNKYSTDLRSKFAFVKELNSMAVQAAAERALAAIANRRRTAVLLASGVRLLDFLTTARKRLLEVAATLNFKETIAQLSTRLAVGSYTQLNGELLLLIRKVSVRCGS